MTARLRTWAAALGLFLVALAVRLVYLDQARADPLYAVVSSIWDSLYYHRHALAIAGIDTSVDPLRNLPYFLGPLYSYFIALIYSLSLPDPEQVRQAQAILGALSCVLVWGIGRELFSERAGVVAGLLLAGYDLQIYYTQILLPTTLVLFLNLLFLWILSVGGGRPTPLRWLLAGLVAGLATAAKTNALLLAPAALAALWLLPQELSRAGRLRVSAALLLGLCLAISPFTLRNWVVSEHFVLVNTTGGRNLWKGNGPRANGTHVALVSPEVLAAGEAADPRERGTNLGDYLVGRVRLEQAVEESAYFTHKTLEHMAGHPGPALALFARKLALFWNAVELGIRDRFYFARRYAPLLQLPLPSFGVIAPLGLAGLLFAWRRRPRTVLLYLLLAVQVVSFVLVFVLARYRIVAAACLCLFAGWLLVEWFDALRARRWRAAVPSLAAALLAAALVHVPIDGFTRERGFGLAHFELGQHYLGRKDYRAALDAFERAQSADWEDQSPERAIWSARLYQAHCWLALGEHERARALLARLEPELRRADPAQPDLRRAAEQLRRRVEFPRERSEPGEPELDLRLE